MSAAGDTIRALMLQDMHWPLDRLQLCVTCNRASILGSKCPACGSGSTSLLTLARVLDRQGAA